MTHTRRDLLARIAATGGFLSIGSAIAGCLSGDSNIPDLSVSNGREAIVRVSLRIQSPTNGGTVLDDTITLEPYRTHVNKSEYGKSRKYYRGLFDSPGEATVDVTLADGTTAAHTWKASPGGDVGKYIRISPDEITFRRIVA